MAQRRNMRRPDAEGPTKRRVPFYVPGESDEAREWRRDSTRYASSGRKSHGPDSPSALPSPPLVRPVYVGVLAALAFLLIVVAALVGFVMSSGPDKGGPASRGGDVLATSTAAIEEMKSFAHMGLVNESNTSAAFTYDLKPSDLLAVPDTAEVMGVDLETSPASSTVCKFDLANVKAALANIEENGHAGFVFVDVNTGRGLLYNASEEMYVASAAKAPYIYWLLSSGIELDEFDNEEVDWIITESDNDSYDDLFMRYYSDGFDDFMRAHGVKHEDYYSDFYPRMNARSLASIWAEILQFIQGGSDRALLLGAHLAATETSFIRDGLAGIDAVVLNKAGWIDEGSYDYYDDEGGAWDYQSVSDAAIIQADGHTYLMVIVTSQPDSDEDETNVSALARALFDVRGAM